jgi:hypothetical protein
MIRETSQMNYGNTPDESLDSRSLTLKGSVADYTPESSRNSFRVAKNLVGSF